MRGSAPTQLARRPGRRGLIAVVILIAALGVRVGYVELGPTYRPVKDGLFYSRLASEIDHRGDYSTSRAQIALHARGPSAYFPPGYPYFLAAAGVLDGHRAGDPGSVRPALLVQAVLGTATAGLAGLVALEAFGCTVGLIALALAAVYPMLIALGGTLTAENLLLALELGALWCILRARRSRRPHPWIASAGLLTGLATLTHLNGVVLLIPLSLAIWTHRPRWSARAFAGPVLLIVTATLAIAPWTIRNAVVMHRFIPVSDETGITLVGTYNDVSAADPKVPYMWRLFFGIPSEAPLIHRVLVGRLSEPQLSDQLLGHAARYLGSHPLAPLDVAYHNTRRLLELEGSYAWRASAAGMGIEPGVADFIVVGFWVLAVLAAIGARTRAARRAPRWLWLIPVLFAASAVFVNVETPRFRAPIDPFLIILAALALTGLCERLRARELRPPASRTDVASDGDRGRR